MIPRSELRRITGAIRLLYRYGTRKPRCSDIAVELQRRGVAGPAGLRPYWNENRVKYILQRSADVGVDIFVTPGAGRPRGIFRIRKSAEAEFSQELEPLLEPKIDGDEPNATAGRLQERERQRQRQRQQQGRRRDDIIEQLG